MINRDNHSNTRGVHASNIKSIWNKLQSNGTNWWRTRQHQSRAIGQIKSLVNELGGDIPTKDNYCYKPDTSPDFHNECRTHHPVQISGKGLSRKDSILPETDDKFKRYKKYLRYNDDLIHEVGVKNYIPIFDIPNLKNKGRPNGII